MDQDIFDMLKDRADSLILTVSQTTANRVNRMAANNLFLDNPCLGQVQLHNSDTLPPFYHDMKVIITQHRDTYLEAANGQHATVLTIQGASIFLK